MLVTVLAAGGSELLDEIAGAVSLDATRHELVDGYVERVGVRRGERLAAVAEHVHRLVRGVRVV